MELTKHVLLDSKVARLWLAQVTPVVSSGVKRVYEICAAISTKPMHLFLVMTAMPPHLMYIGISTIIVGPLAAAGRTSPHTDYVLSCFASSQVWSRCNVASREVCLLEHNR
jgi:hypothetical protein